MRYKSKGVGRIFTRIAEPIHRYTVNKDLSIVNINIIRNPSPFHLPHFFSLPPSLIQGPKYSEYFWERNQRDFAIENFTFYEKIGCLAALITKTSSFRTLV